MSSDVTPKFRIVAMLVAVDLHTVFYTKCILFTGQEMIFARNAIDAHVQNILVNDDLLLFILKTFSQYTRSLQATRNSWCFQAVCGSRTVCLSHQQHSSNHPHCARSLTPWGDELVICGRWICLRSICVPCSTSSCSSFPWNRKPKNIFLRRNLLFHVLTLYRLLFQMSASGMEELITRISLSSVRNVRKSSSHLQETLNSQPTDERSWWWGYLRVSSPLSLISVAVSLTYRSQDM